MSDQRGEISLVGLIVSMTIFLSVLAGTLSLYTTSERVGHQAQERNDLQQQARVTLDRLSRQLRNLASPTPERPEAVDRAGARDLVFQTVALSNAGAGSNATNVMRVRYCLDAGGRLHRQAQTWTTAAPPAAPAGTDCPAAGWSGDYVVATNVDNVRRGVPLFMYDSTALDAVTRIGVNLWIDADPTRSPSAAHLTTSVFLRNQNRAPVASFTATPTAQGILLNGSASADPEDAPLTYCWYDAAAPVVPAASGSPCEAGPRIGTGITLSYAMAQGATRNISLSVYDPAGLFNRTTVRSITNAGGVQ